MIAPMALRAFHPILYVADPYAERDFFGHFGFETVYRAMISRGSLPWSADQSASDSPTIKTLVRLS